jgi:hypothetical protein
MDTPKPKPTSEPSQAEQTDEELMNDYTQSRSYVDKAGKDCADTKTAEEDSEDD